MQKPRSAEHVSSVVIELVVVIGIVRCGSAKSRPPGEIGKGRRVYSDEFKLEWVRRVARREQLPTQSARERDISHRYLQHWRKPLRAPSETVVDRSLEEERRRLRWEVASVKEDRHIPKYRSDLCEKVPVQYAFVDVERTQHRV